MKKNRFLPGFILGLFVFGGVTMAINFNDITNHWAKDNLVWAINNGLLEGDNVAKGKEKTLRPDDAITRAEMVTILKHYDKLQNGTEKSENSNNQPETFTTTIGELTWVGRKFVNNKGGTIYQAIKIDKFGNETVVYETIFTPYSDFKWDFSEDGKYVVIKSITAGGDAADFTEIVFKDGEEMIRSHYSSYEKELTFKLPHSPINTVTLATSKRCEGVIRDSKTIVPQTELMGIKINSNAGSKTFNLAKSEIVDCATHDGMFTDHRPQGVITSAYGISFSLPNGDRASISTSEGLEKMSVDFQPADLNQIELY